MDDRTRIKRFQSEAYDWTGGPLEPDGVAGPRTKWALAVADLPRWRREILRIAPLFLGVREDPLGSNRGRQVEAWLAGVGVEPGNPWCAAFVFDVLTRAGVPAVRTASARVCLEQFDLIALPSPGDLFGWVNTDGTGHVGFVIGDSPEGIATIEGNVDHGVRSFSRPLTGGLQFRQVRTPVRYAARVEGLPLKARSSGTTR